MKILITLSILLSTLCFQALSQDVLEFKRDQRPSDGALTELLLSFNEQDESVNVNLISTAARRRVSEGKPKTTTVFSESQMKCAGSFSQEFKGMIQDIHCYKRVENRDYVYIGFQLKLNERKLYDAFSYTKDHSRVRPTLIKLVSDLENIISD